MKLSVRKGVVGQFIPARSQGRMLKNMAALGDGSQLPPDVRGKRKAVEKNLISHHGHSQP